MLDHALVADTTGILDLNDCVPPARRAELFEALTPLVEKGTLAIPRAVVKDLLIRARHEQITAWAQGLGSILNKFAAKDECQVWLMRKVQIEFGYEEGVEDVDGKDPSIVAVVSYARQLEIMGGTFTVVSCETGQYPLRPTMEQFCRRFGWNMEDGTSCLELLGIGSLCDEQ